MAFVPQYILVLFFIIIIDYLSALAIEKSKKPYKRFYLVASLLSNILLLGFFKYFNFVNDNVESVFHLFGKDFHPINLEIILPIGLSFHTFQSMSYTIEVYRGKQKAEKHIGYFANYVLFFPQMVAGPIERYDGLGAELKKKTVAEYSNFSEGFRLILFGLFVKMAVADNIAPIVNEVYKSPLSFNAWEVWLSVFLFSFQIYADFYGYSTIAMGSARLLGIRIMDNFRTPYLAKSVTEFWTRWHISLSTWFRDYLYIPLGGNRVKLPRWSCNIMLVFMVSGLWHGASWTFVAWGALHGLLLLGEGFYRKLFNARTKNYGAVSSFLGIVKTFVLTSLIWIFFRAESFQNAKDMFSALMFNYELPSNLNDFAIALVFSFLLIVADLFLYNSRIDERLKVAPLLARWSVYTVLIFLLMTLSGTQKFAFIYFQF